MVLRVITNAGNNTMTVMTAMITMVKKVFRRFTLPEYRPVHLFQVHQHPPFHPVTKIQTRTASETTTEFI